MKISVLAGHGASTAVLLNWLLQKGYDDIDLILEARPGRVSQLRRRARRQGWSRTLGQALFMAVIVPLLRRESAARRRELLDESGVDEQMPTLPRRLDVSSINDAAALRRLQSYDPDVVLVNGTSILRAPTLSAVPVRFINTHVGLTPYYRGVHGGYWALWNQDAENFGSTLHLIDEGVDTGGILAQVTVTPKSRDNFASYPLLQQTAILESLRHLLERIAQGDPVEPLPAPSEQGRQWSHPTAFDYLQGRFRGVR